MSAGRRSGWIGVVALAWAGTLMAAQTPPASSARTYVDLDADWRFSKGDFATATTPGIRRSGWRTVNLPHDWSIEGPFGPEYGSGNGYAPGGIGWYRRHFTLDAAHKDKLVAIEFDGVYDHAEVWINGHFVGGRPYGYSSFQCDLTPLLRFGDRRERRGRARGPLPVRRFPLVHRLRHLPSRPPADHRQAPDRPLGHLCHHAGGDGGLGRGARGDRGGERLRPVPGVLPAIGGHRPGWPSGRQCDPGSDRGGGQELDGRPADHPSPSPQLWSPSRRSSTPSRAACMVDAATVDETATPFGIRTLRFDPDKGFFLNGKSDEDQGRVHPSRCRPPGRRRSRQGAGTTPAHPEGDGRQRHPDQPQSTRTGTAGPVRPARTAGQGRGVRRVHAGQEQVGQRPQRGPAQPVRLCGAV